MYPVIVLFGKEISMYAVMAAIGILVSGYVFCVRIKKSGHDDNDAILFLLFVGGGVLVGGHIMYGAVNARYIPSVFKAESLGEALALLGRIFGGSVFYGGLIGAFLFGLIYIRIFKLPKDIYIDNFALLAPLFHAFARVGCFFGGCCYGIESDIGFCAHGNTLTDIGEVRRFPVQLLESFLDLCIALVIYLLLKNGKAKGRTFYIYLIMYSFVRFFDELLRGDDIRGFVFGLSTSQFISILVMMFAVISLLIARFKSARER